VDPATGIEYAEPIRKEELAVAFGYRRRLDEFGA
jgi:hypothetical protein